MERRKFLRFPVRLMVKLEETAKPGITKDFSREGLRATFENFKFEKGSLVELRIQRPDKEVFIPVGAEVMWKRSSEGRWEAGFRLRDFPGQVKAEILECGYHNWLDEKLKR